MFRDRNVNMKINRLHERALRIVYQDDLSSFDDLLKRDGSFSIHEKNIQILAIELYKSKHGLANELMQGVFPSDVLRTRNLRHVPEFAVPKVSTVHHGDDSLRHFGPLIWEKVPTSLKALPLKQFKVEVKKWKPEKCPCRLCKPYIQGVGYLDYNH